MKLPSLFQPKDSSPNRASTTPDMGDRSPEGTYIELVQSLFANGLPAVIMTICFVTAGSYIVARTPDLPLEIFFALGIATSIARLAVLFISRREVMEADIEVHRVHALERRFGIAYFAYAACFGAFVARAFGIADPAIHILLVALLFGYGAGVAATVSLRPWISISAILIAVLPMIAVSLAMTGASFWGTGLLTALFLAGGVQNMFQRYRGTSAQITMRRLLATMARQDDLTELPNRLMLRERFAELSALAGDSDMIALFRLDLDRFKSINEAYGHPVGDDLLKAVAQRLNRVARPNHLAVRLGADDFVMIQTGFSQQREADILAHQIMTALSKPYLLHGHDYHVGISIGFAIDQRLNADLDGLLGRADLALRQAKQEASGLAQEGQRGWAA